VVVGDFVVAVVGATGAVGQEMLRTLEQRNFPVRELRAFASPRSAGRSIPFRGTQLLVQAIGTEAFRGVDVALFSAGAERSRIYAPQAVAAGALVIDNSSAFRMQADVPLVVPEVNPETAAAHRGLIANPNCSTIQMVVALRPVRDLFGLRRIVVSTYQSVSGTGARGIRELDAGVRAHLAGEREATDAFPHPIAFDVLPQVDVFDGEGHTREETKMREETRKILGEAALPVIATCVRVPVVRCHSEAVLAETQQPVDLGRLRDALAAAPGVELRADAAAYPVAREAAHRDAVYVGRLRMHPGEPRAVSMWVVSDNLRKGAALNAVQIAELVCRTRPRLEEART
jgi:aspartate-semialdehyde dehydrogenase